MTFELILVGAGIAIVVLGIFFGGVKISNININIASNNKKKTTK